MKNDKANYNNNNELIRRYQDGEKNLFETLLENNKGLIQVAISRYIHLARKTVLYDFDDLQNDLMCLFKEALDTFDLNLGYTFSNWFFSIVPKINNISKLYKNTKKKGTVSYYGSFRRSIQNECPIPLVPNQEGEEQLFEFADEKAEQEFYQKEIEITLDRKNLLRILKKALTEKQFIVICGLYGLDGKEKTLGEIADELNCASSLVEHLSYSALQILYNNADLRCIYEGITNQKIKDKVRNHTNTKKHQKKEIHMVKIDLNDILGDIGIK